MMALRNLPFLALPFFAAGCSVEEFPRDRLAREAREAQVAIDVNELKEGSRYWGGKVRGLHQVQAAMHEKFNEQQAESRSQVEEIKALVDDLGNCLANSDWTGCADKLKEAIPLVDGLRDALPHYKEYTRNEWIQVSCEAKSAAEACNSPDETDPRKRIESAVAALTNVVNSASKELRLHVQLGPY